MTAVRIIAWSLCTLSALAFVIMLIAASVKSASSAGDSSATDLGIPDIVKIIPSAEVPPAMDETDYTDYSSSPITPEAATEFANDNGFIILNSHLLILGLLGYAMMIAALARQRPGYIILPAIFGMAGIVFACFFLFGFDFAYPGDSFIMGGLIPTYSGPWFAFPEEDIYSYGLAMTMWTDFLYQAAYAICAASPLLALMAGRYRAPVVMTTAILVGAIGYPLVTSWLWGAGWLYNFSAMDFAGGSNLHALCGGAGLALVFMARVFPAHRPGSIMPAPPTDHDTRAIPSAKMTPARSSLFIGGAIIYLLLPLGVQAGSVLSNDPGIVAGVIRTSISSLLAATLTSAALSIFLALRSRLVIIALGGIVGWSTICAPVEILTLSQAAGLGALAGALCTTVLWLLDRYQFDDPLGIIPVHLIGGSLGLLAAGVFNTDTSLLAQTATVFSTAAVGFSFGGATGLAGWLSGFLWTPDRSPSAVWA